MWVRPFTLVVLILLDLGVIGILMLQTAKGLPLSANLILPTLGFNLFGALIVWAIKRD